jgi:hypothetical protein
MLFVFWKVCLGFQTLFQRISGFRSLLSAPFLCREATRSDVWSLLSVHVTITPFWRLPFLNRLNSTGVLRKRAIRHQFGNNKSLPGTFIDKGLQNSGDPSTPRVRASQGWQNTARDLLRTDSKFQSVTWRENKYNTRCVRCVCACIIEVLSLSEKNSCRVKERKAFRISVFKCVRRIAKSDYLLRYVCLSVRMEQLGPHWTDFHEIWHLRI